MWSWYSRRYASGKLRTSVNALGRRSPSASAGAAARGCEPPAVFRGVLDPGSPRAENAPQRERKDPPAQAVRISAKPLLRQRLQRFRLDSGTKRCSSGTPRASIARWTIAIHRRIFSAFMAEALCVRRPVLAGVPASDVWEQEAAGSNPAIPTRSKHKLILNYRPASFGGPPRIAWDPGRDACGASTPSGPRCLARGRLASEPRRDGFEKRESRRAPERSVRACSVS